MWACGVFQRVVVLSKTVQLTNRYTQLCAVVACVRSSGTAAAQEQRHTARGNHRGTTVEARDAQATDDDGQVPGRARKAGSAGHTWRARIAFPRSVGKKSPPNDQQQDVRRRGDQQRRRRRRGSFDGRRCAAAAADDAQAAPWKTVPGLMAAAAAQDHLKRILRKALRKSRLNMV